jgi:predicted secreted protein
MGYKTILFLFAASLSALIISFCVSPPGTPPKPCLDETSIRDLQKNINDLKKTLYDC